MLLRFLAAFALACGGIGFAAAAPSVPDSEAGLGAAEATAWLTRIQQAVGNTSFRGTFVVSAGGSMSSSRIEHYSEADQQFEHIESLDGQMRRVFRHNDVVHTLWPQSRVALVEQWRAASLFPSLLQGNGRSFAERYTLRLDGVDRVAGHEAQVLRVDPKDGDRYGYRLWSDRATGLLLRADVLGARGDVLESVAFSELSLGVKPKSASVLKSMRKLDGYRVLRPDFTPTQLDIEGWVVNASIPGFRQISCVKRTIEAQGGGAHASELVQAVWSDGLTTVSVFLEPFNGERHAKEMQTSIGATQTVMWRKADWWVTVMGDVPAPTLLKFAQSLERVR